MRRFFAVLISYIVYKGQKQLIVPLWEYISCLHEINPKKPITPNIIKAINTLELIAITCEGKMINKTVIKRTFSQQYIKHFDNIQSCQVIPGLEPKTGNDLLRENPATLSFYDELMNDLKNTNKIGN